jgi:hypothetical protein
MHADVRPTRPRSAPAAGGHQVSIFNGNNETLLSTFFALPTFFTGGVRVGYNGASGVPRQREAVRLTV